MGAAAVHIDPVAETKKTRRVTFFSTGYEMVRVEGPEEADSVVVTAAAADNSGSTTALDSPIPGSPAPPGSFENPLFVQHRSFWNEFHGSIGFFPDENAAETFCELPLISYKRPWNVAEVLPSVDPPGQQQQQSSLKTRQDDCCVVHNSHDATTVEGSANAAAELEEASSRTSDAAAARLQGEAASCALNGSGHHRQSPPPAATVIMPCTNADDLKMLKEECLFEAGEHTPFAPHQAACCPWATFGKKMERAGFGATRGQGGVFLLLFLGALGSYIVFTYTGRPWYIYGTLSLILLMATYAGFYCARMRRRFNNDDSNGDNVVSTIGDHVSHLMCGCCSLCQEARTLNSDNVQNAVWHGHNDFHVIGNQVVFSPIASGKSSSSSWKMLPPWRIQSSQSKESAVITVTSDSDLEDQQTWSQEDSDSVPLMKLGP
ncbi:unnamed protein product [Sphagnum compactum]